MTLTAIRLISKLLALSVLISALIKYIGPILNPSATPGLIWILLLSPAGLMAGLLALQPVLPDDPN
ncbi:MAG: hypothetical protein LVS60_00475 [Nodosilinea sp. LVE1205-7]|jgi:hypothetical protein